MTRICIDGWNLALVKGSGIQVYGRNLLDAYGSLGCERHVLYGPSAPRSKVDILNEIALSDARPSRQKKGMRRAITTVTSRWGRSAWPVPVSDDVIWPRGAAERPRADVLWASTDLFNLSNRAFHLYRTVTPLAFDGARGPDVMHWTCPIPARARNAANIYTIHDLIPLKLPHSTLDDKRAFFDLCQRIVRDADHILTVSETTRHDVIKLLGADPARVTTTYQAVTPKVDHRSEAEMAAQIEGALGLPWKGYFLFYGAIEPKKNLGRLVEAYVASKSRTPLVVVAGREWLAERELGLLKEAAEHGEPGRIRLLDYLPSTVLETLIKGARATLFPSLYEGFGLPLLESMLAGTPVMTSTGGALPEIAGEAALVVQPLDVDAMRRAIESLDHDADLRAELAAVGRIRAAAFDETAYRRRLGSVYKALGVSLPGAKD